jgi:hypothetical protein
MLLSASRLSGLHLLSHVFQVCTSATDPLPCQIIPKPPNTVSKKITETDARKALKSLQGSSLQSRRWLHLDTAGFLPTPAQEPPGLEMRNSLCQSMLQRMATLDRFTLRFKGARRETGVSGGSLLQRRRGRSSRRRVAVRSNYCSRADVRAVSQSQSKS